jgi:hypothetical protein
MMSLYKQISGKKPGISVGSPGRAGHGKPGGPLIRFLETAGKPLGIRLSSASLAGRIRDVLSGGRRRKNKFDCAISCEPICLSSVPEETKASSSLVRLYAEALAGEDQAARTRLLTVDVSPSWTEPQV